MRFEKGARFLLAGSCVVGGLLAAWSIQKLPVLLSPSSVQRRKTDAASEYPVLHLPKGPRKPGASGRTHQPNILIPIPAETPPPPLPREFPSDWDIHGPSGYLHAIPFPQVGTTWNGAENAAWRESVPRSPSGRDDLVPVPLRPRKEGPRSAEPEAGG